VLLIARGINAEIPTTNLGYGTRSNASAVHAREVGATEIAAPVAVLGVGQGIHTGPVTGNRACRAVLGQIANIAGIARGRAGRPPLFLLAFLLFPVGVNLVLPLQCLAAATRVAISFLLFLFGVSIKADEPSGHTDQPAQSSPPRTHGAGETIESGVVHGFLQSGSGEYPELDYRENRKRAHQ
jgi:hypothetical protein